MNDTSTTTETAEQPERVLLVGIRLGNSREDVVIADHLDELADLSETYGLDVVDRIIVPRKSIDRRTVVGPGKLEELTAIVADNEIDMVIFDDELRPTQRENLKRVWDRDVIDRRELIMGIFSQRAQTHEARLQVELAQARYELSQLKGLWTHLNRQGGGGGGAGGGHADRGEGEKQIEVDRRLLADRVNRLRTQLADVQATRANQRKARSRNPIPVVSIVGYTNAGKSTLLNALTDAGVNAENKLFATLDPTTRQLTLPNHQSILLSDTVGFIRKLPHHLVEAFRSTLEEAANADIVLHLVDVAHPSARQHAETTLEVLDDLGIGDKPVLTVLNKTDRPGAAATITALRAIDPSCVAISATTGAGFDELQTALMAALAEERQVVRLRIPQAEYGVVAAIEQQGRLLNKDYAGNDVLLEVEIENRQRHSVEPYLCD